MQGGSCKTVVAEMTGTSRVWVPYSPHRRALIIANNGTGSYWLAWGADAVEGQSTCLVANSAPLVLNERDHGPMVYGPIYALNSGGNNPCEYVEVLAGDAEWKK